MNASSHQHRSSKTSARRRGAEMPEFVPPQLCTLVDRPPSQVGWGHEVSKHAVAWDGAKNFAHALCAQMSRDTAIDALSKGSALGTVRPTTRRSRSRALAAP